jgi:hypothetical protein
MSSPVDTIPTSSLSAEQACQPSQQELELMERQVSDLLRGGDDTSSSKDGEAGDISAAQSDVQSDVPSESEGEEEDELVDSASDKPKAGQTVHHAGWENDLEEFYKSKRICTYHWKPNGCSKGDNCKYLHCPLKAYLQFKDNMREEKKLKAMERDGKKPIESPSHVLGGAVQAAFYCQACDRQCNSAAQYSHHLHSAGHDAQLVRLKGSASGQPSVGKPTVWKADVLPSSSSTSVRPLKTQKANTVPASSNAPSSIQTSTHPPFDGLLDARVKGMLQTLTPQERNRIYQDPKLTSLYEKYHMRINALLTVLASDALDDRSH